MVIRRLTDRFVALVAFLPVGLERVLAAAVGLRSSAVVPLTAFALVLIGLFPLAQAGVELITHRATPGDVIERRAGDLTMLEVSGIGYDTGLAAGTDADGRALRWLAMRDGLDDRRVMLVRTPVEDTALRIREVVGRVRSDPSLVASVTDALATRGAPGPGDPASVAALGGRVIVEAPAADADGAQRIDDPAAITDLADGTLVRVKLRFTGEGIATCTLDGSCDARVLGTGDGTWLLRAAAARSTQAVLIRSSLPPTAFPITVVGRQVRDPAAVDAMLATAGGRSVLGWSRALDVALIDHDPALPADRVWGGALLLVALGLLLVLGRRIRYPVFRHEGAVSRRAVVVTSPVAGMASGRLGLPEGAPVDVIGMPVSVEPTPDAAPTLVASLPSGEVRLEVPRSSATASGVKAATHRPRSRQRPGRCGSPGSDRPADRIRQRGGSGRGCRAAGCHPSSASRPGGRSAAASAPRRPAPDGDARNRIRSPPAGAGHDPRRALGQGHHHDRHHVADE